MDRRSSGYYEPPPDYSDSDEYSESSSELQCKSLGNLNLSVLESETEQEDCGNSTRMMESRGHDAVELHVMPLASARLQNFIPRSNWTLCEKKMPRPMQRNTSGVGDLSDGYKTARSSFLAPKLSAQQTIAAQRLLLPPPPPIPQVTRVEISGPPPQHSPNGSDIVESPKPKPRRTMSVKSNVNPFNQDTMKPLINEFRFYQKTQKSILGQKSELQKVIEKRQQREKTKQIEEEKTKKTGLEKILELRQLRITNGTANLSGPANGDNFGISSMPELRGPVSTNQGLPLPSKPGVAVVSAYGQYQNNVHSNLRSNRPGSVNVGHHQLTINANNEHNSNSNQVKLILKSMESNSNSDKLSESATRKFYKRPLEFPMTGGSVRSSSNWSAVKTNYVR